VEGAEGRTAAKGNKLHQWQIEKSHYLTCLQNECLDLRTNYFFPLIEHNPITLYSNEIFQFAIGVTESSLNQQDVSFVFIDKDREVQYST
jgi:hypothetical protein